MNYLKKGCIKHKNLTQKSLISSMIRHPYPNNDSKKFVRSLVKLKKVVTRKVKNFDRIA
jgi:hypothetical protein